MRFTWKNRLDAVLGPRRPVLRDASHTEDVRMTYNYSIQGGLPWQKHLLYHNKIIII